MLSERIKTDFEERAVLRERKDCRITLVREKRTGHLYAFRRFRGEPLVYEKLCHIQCNNLPHTIEVQAVDGEVLVLEEYLEGDTLRFLLQGGPLTLPETLEIAGQLCRALAVLHSMGIVHRDIKPDNVMVCGQRVVLFDFDASRVFKADSSTDTRIMGTTGYAAPEQYGFGQTDGRADIYAMGVLLNVLQTGQHPSHVLAGGRLRPIIQNCIYVNADRRYPTAEALAAALRRAERRPLKPIFAVSAAVLLLLAAGFGLGRLTAPAAPPVEPPAAEAPPVVLQAPLPDTYKTSFFYDLDGDGVEEPYVFAMKINVEADGKNIGPTDRDSLCFGSFNDSNLRFVTPMVWQPGEQGYEPVPAFGPLLEQVRSHLYCVVQEGETPLEATPMAPTDGIWQGSLCIRQSPRNAGLWLITATATLDGKALEASLLCDITCEP